MKYSNDYSNGDNYISVEEWIAKKVNGEPDYIYSSDGEYYYEIEMILDDNECFEQLVVRKVGGGDDDGARGGEWYEEMSKQDITMILRYVKNFIEV